MLTFFVIAPIFLAVLLYLLPFTNAKKYLVILAQSALLVAAIHLFYRAQGGEIITNIGNYTGYMGIILRADSLSAVFVILTTLIFLVVSIYCFNESNSKLFWFLFFIWEGAFIGLFLTRDLFNIFVLAEVSSAVAAVLLMYKRSSRSGYHGIVYLMVNVIVMQLYLFGVGYLYMLAGALDMEYASRVIQTTLEPSQLVLPYALIMTAIAAKCSLMPLFIFLPKVQALPRAPVSVAALMSGLQAKSGLYLFLRFRDIFEGVHVGEVFLVIGVITAVGGILLALAQTDVKLLLAYSTVAQMGLIVVGLSLDGAYAHVGSLYHIISHAISKSALFLGTGIVIRVYNTRDINHIHGLLRRMPLLGVCLLASILAITGVPFFSGNISKYFMMAEAGSVLNGIMTLINMGTILVFIKYARILFEKPEGGEDWTVRVDVFKQAALVILATLGLIGGIWGTRIMQLLFGAEVTIDTAGYIQKIVILAASWGVGLLLYRQRRHAGAALRAVTDHLELGFRAITVSVGAFLAALLIVVGWLA